MCLNILDSFFVVVVAVLIRIEVYFLHCFSLTRGGGVFSLGRTLKEDTKAFPVWPLTNREGPFNFKFLSKTSQLWKFHYSLLRHSHIFASRILILSDLPIVIYLVTYPVMSLMTSYMWAWHGLCEVNASKLASKSI